MQSVSRPKKVSGKVYKKIHVVQLSSCCTIWYVVKPYSLTFSIVIHQSFLRHKVNSLKVSRGNTCYVTAQPYGENENTLQLVLLPRV